MPTEQAVWGIEIGQCALKALRLSYDPDEQQVEVLAFDFIEHPKNLSQPDADPDELTRQALETFLSRNDLKGDSVCIGVPGQSGLARFIKLPPVEQSRIPEIVRYEARQQIPFALEEVIWDYQTIGNAEETEGYAVETEIGLFAMKRELVQRYLSPFLEAGVEVDLVQMRPLAVYNFASFDRLPPVGDGGGQQLEDRAFVKKQAGQDGFVVLLDIGSDNSDLVITNGTQIWQRNLPLGGNHFTRALTKELKLTFAKAEHIKRNATKTKDPRVIFQAMRPVFNDFVSEIQRSVGYFASVHRQSKITKIIGMGNVFKLPGLQKFLSQNLHYEVEKLDRFDRLQGDAILSAPVFRENVLSFGVACGLALQGLGLAEVRTSLLPPEILRARMIRRKKPLALAAAAMLLAGFAVLFAGNWSVLHAVNRPEYEEAEKKAQAAVSLQKQKEDTYNAAKTSWEGVKQRGATLTGVVNNRLAWMEVLQVINNAMPHDGRDPEQRREEVTRLQELQITNVEATWYQDVKTEWYDDAIMGGQAWGGIDTVHPYDLGSPPTGEGWVFTLEGYHFNEDGQSYTLELVRPPGRPWSEGRLQSAEVRSAGISSAVLMLNDTDENWVPGSETRRTALRGPASRGPGRRGPRTRPSSTRPRGGRGFQRSGLGMRTMGSRMTMQGAQPSRATGMPGASGAGSTPEGALAQTVPRTYFIVEFAWQPLKKGEKTREQTQQELEQAEQIWTSMPGGANPAAPAP